jgi:DNA modification methylase
LIAPYFQSENVTLYNADCLDIVPQLEAQSVDTILTDVPYGTTACSWDVVIPFPDMWKVVKHVLKKKGAFVTTASQPFTSKLVCSNLEWFKYEWIWRKNRITGFLNANKKPMVQHENIVVFSAGTEVFNPQMRNGKKHTRGSKYDRTSENYGDFEYKEYQSNEWYPTTVLDFDAQSDSCVTFAQKPNRLDTHPTQKPEALYRYLALTYTNPGDTVLDFCFGSGTTGVACVQTGRKFIGIEISKEYCDIAVKRIKDAEQQMRLF